ncbi:MAG: hypothetical protein C4K48_04795 [Candidatus Thorarchaeota archaeon]|nr:MAG: hypothetical protein C4K48_04795 [Candidatus Thorarchaeota archaeon]
MMHQLLEDSIKRHLEETLPLIEQLNGIDIMNRPVAGGREVGELVLHLLRSLEFYMKGVVTGNWKPLPYNLETYTTSEAIIQLAREVFDRVRADTSRLSALDLKRVIKTSGRPGAVGGIILEMLEHSIHHRGQITVYYRLLGIAPAPISYIV